MMDSQWVRRSVIIATALAGAIVGFARAGIALADEPAKADFVVATNGNDDWSGRTDTITPDHKDGPFATLKRALLAVRELRKASPDRKAPVVIEVRGGTYRLTEPIVLTPEDSGTADSPTIVRARAHEKPVFSGGVPLTNGKADDKGRWVFDVPAVKSGNWNFVQLFVNGERRYRPRLPKNSYSFIAGELDPSPAANGRGDNRFKFKAGEMKSSWSNLNDIEVHGFQVWTMARFRIESIDDAERIVTFTGTTRGREGYSRLSTGKRYLIENVKEALDQPGEWYLDRKEGKLTYIPMPGEDLAKAEVVAPKAERLMRIEGDIAGGKLVECVLFEGLTFAHTNWVTPKEGNAFPQAEVNLGAAIDAVGTHICRFNDCTIEHVGEYAIQFGPGCKACRLSGCVLADLGGGGVKIGSTGFGDEAHTASENSVNNCLIETGGRLHPAAVGVWIGQSHHNQVTHNTIRDFYYSGISVGWTWGYGRSDAHDNLFEANHVYKLGQHVLSDMGAIYSLGVSPGTVVKGNHFHDVNSFDYGGWGIYFDEGSTGIHAEGNVVYRCKTGNLHQHYGKENVVERNVFVDAGDPQLARTRLEPHVSFIFKHNVVSYETGNLLGGNWGGDDSYVIDENLYWRHGEPIAFAGGDLAAWQKRGHDGHSIIADPKFVDAAHDDYRLQPGSPAEKIGCPSLDVREAGCHLPVAKEREAHPAARAYPPPPPPQPVADDFEDTAVGSKSALAFTSEENAEATIRVTDETASSGKHSLKFIDGPGQKQGFNPHWYYHPDFAKGVIEARFALRHEPGAIISHEWRDVTNPYHVGPAIYVDADGTLRARDRTLGKLPAGQWAKFVIDCGMGKAATGEWNMDIKVGDGTLAHLTGLPCDRAFKELRWFGFSSQATTKTVFYIDDVFLGPIEARP